MERLPVRDVADVALEERHPARRVDCFENERSAGLEFVVRGFEETNQVSGFEVFDDLNGDETAQTGVALALEKLERVASLHLESACPTELHHRVVTVDPARRDPLLAQQIEQLAPSATNVEDIRSRPEDGDVILHP